MRRYWFRTRRFLVHNLLHADDTPHRIALGAGIAMFVAMLPLIGLQTIIAVALAALARANKAICIPIVWITNPATAVPIYGVCFAVGRMILAPFAHSPDVAVEVVSADLEQKLAPAVHHSMWELAFWTDLLSTLAGLGAELWLGCVVLGVPMAVGTYFLLKWWIVRHRRHVAERRARRDLFRARRRAERHALQHAGAAK